MCMLSNFVVFFNCLCPSKPLMDVWWSGDDWWSLIFLIKLIIFRLSTKKYLLNKKFVNFCVLFNFAWNLLSSLEKSAPRIFCTKGCVEIKNYMSSSNVRVKGKSVKISRSTTNSVHANSSPSKYEISDAKKEDGFEQLEANGGLDVAQAPAAGPILSNCLRNRRVQGQPVA